MHRRSVTRLVAADDARDRSRSRSPAAPRSPRPRRTRRRAPSRSRCASATSPTSPTPGARRCRRAASSPRSSATTSTLEAEAPSTRAPRPSQAIQADALDASYIGPNPTITAWTQFDKGVRVISGRRVRWRVLRGEARHQQRRRPQGQDVATPQLGNTQDVALAHLAEEEGPRHRHRRVAATCRSARRTTPRRSTPFKTGDIEGAWVPEPWATRLVTEGGGKILVDEATLWPKGQYVTTQLIVTTSFLKAHPDVGAEARERAGRGERLHQDRTPPTRSRSCQQGIAAGNRQADRRRPRHRVVQEHRRSRTTRSRRRW